MAIELISIGSSSSGNSYIIKTEEAVFLLDVGLSASKIVAALESCGIEPESVQGIFITHEHIDHVKSVRAIARRCPNAVFYASRGTMDACEAFCHVDADRCVTVASRESFSIADAELHCFALSHDAREPLGYSVIAGGRQLSVITDTGIITEEIYEEMIKADLLVFEANHEEELLMFGPYPYHVKQRIKSDIGHLSNVSSGEFLARMLRERVEQGKSVGPRLMLAHLSEKNNTAFQARMTVEDILRAHGFERERDYSLNIAAKEGLTYISNAD